MPSSPKTRWIEMMDEEREEQQRALDQIEDCDEETRPCPECRERISVKCFRKHHFFWCTTHELFSNSDGDCPESPPNDAPQSVARCTEVQCDKTEEEAYWEEVEENGMKGGAGFREPGEGHVD